jgi:hyperosmotically inducible periplasmic protein
MGIAANYPRHHRHHSMSARVLLSSVANGFRINTDQKGGFMKRVLFVGTLAFALFAAPLAWAENYPADNTGKNVRDRSGDTLTSGDQSEDKTDLNITQQIRKAIVGDDSLSTNAHNVKIITTGGVVTLRGPVNNDAEKAKVVATAQKIAGVKHVDNQLEVTRQ